MIDDVTFHQKYFQMSFISTAKLLKLMICAQMNWLNINALIFVFSITKAKAGEELFKTVDINEDGKLEFKEFAVLVCSFACSNYDALQDVMKNCKSDGGK